MTANNNDNSDARLETARLLVEKLEKGDETNVTRLIGDLNRSADFNLFEELGRMTRDLHDALVSFQTDNRITQLAEEEIPDAKDRLNYVISMTEQAANRTLDMVEKSLPLTDNTEEDALALGESLRRFRQRDMSLDEFREFCDRLEGFLAKTAENAVAMRANLSDVLMAQDFQDLTGQMIRRVITLVHDVEENLVGLIRMSGNMYRSSDQPREKDPHELEGPQHKAQEREDVVANQDDVDDLLSSLGF